MLANLRFPCLLLETGGQLPDDQGGRQHHGEGHQILDVADGQRKARRHEKYVEKEDAQDGRQDGGAPPEADRDQQYREQEEHHDVGEIEMAEQRGGQQRGGGTGERRQQGALPGGKSFCGFDNRLAFVLHDLFPVIQSVQTMPPRVKTLIILAKPT